MSRARSSDLRALLILAGVTVVLFADVLFAGSGFFFRDLFRYHFPMKQIVRDTIARGEFPWWNRFISAGQPMAANPAYEIFYPPQWLIFIGPFRFGFNLHILFHVALALGGMYALLRTLRLRSEAALFGALSFGLGAYFLSTTATLPMMFVWSWAPLAACLVLRWLEAPSSRRFAFAAIVLAMQLLIVEPVSLLQVWTLILIGVALRERSVGRTAMRVAALAIAAAALAAVQLLPAIDHVHDSARSRGFPYETVVDSSLSPLRLIELVEPHAFGIVDAHEPKLWGGDVYGGRGTPYVTSLYCGIAVTIFALAGFLARIRGARIAAAICGVSFLLALGGETPLFRAIYAIGIHSLRYPEKFIAAALITLVVFAAYAVDRFLDGDERIRRAGVIASAIIAAITAIVAAWTLMPGFTTSFIRFWKLRDAAAPLASFARTQWLIAFAFAASWCALLISRTRHLRPLALVLIIADVSLVANEVAPRLPSDFFTPPPIAARLEPDRDAYSIFHRASWSGGSDSAHFLNRSMHWTARNGLRPFTASAWGFRSALEADYDETDLLPTHDLLDAMQGFGATGNPRWSEPFATMSNVRYIIDYANFDQAMNAARGDITIVLPIRVRRVLADQPRYYFAQRVVATDDMVGALMTNPDARLTAFVPSVEAGASPAWRPERPPPHLLAVRETSSSATIDVETAANALFVMTVTRHKYWRVTIDGRDADVIPANLAFQAVVVPAERHRVEMHYRNPLVLIGAAISLLALCAAAIATVR
jgi:hypothetical protein